MGKVVSLMMRPIIRFNIDNRAHKVISKEKPVRAPLPPKAEQQLELAQKLNPKFMDEESKRNMDLDDRLKSVYVTSSDPQVPDAGIERNPSKPLPQFKHFVPDFEFGYAEPSVITEGKCTLRQAIEFLTKYTVDQSKYTSGVIAKEYKLDEKVVEDILNHFVVHRMVVPPNWTEEQKTDMRFLKYLHSKQLY